MSARIGVLALQGDFAAHGHLLTDIGATCVEIRTTDDLAGVDGVVVPGGESTTMSLLVRSTGLLGALESAIREGLPVFGTCAGMIMLASTVLDGRADQATLGALDITVRRNGYGRQAQSFEVDLGIGAIPGGDVAPFHGVFIRAPRIERCGPDVSVLAEHDGSPVLVRQGSVAAASFHPELTADHRLHRLFVEEIVGRGGSRPPRAGGSPESGDVVSAVS